MKPTKLPWGAIIVAGAIALHATSQRYEINTVMGGMTIYRIDRWTGVVEKCVDWRGPPSRIDYRRTENPDWCQSVNDAR